MIEIIEIKMLKLHKYFYYFSKIPQVWQCIPLKLLNLHESGKFNQELGNGNWGPKVKNSGKVHGSNMHTWRKMYNVRLFKKQ